MKVIQNISFSDRISFPDRISASNGALYLSAKNKVSKHMIYENHFSDVFEVNFPSINEDFLYEYLAYEKDTNTHTSFIVSKTDKQINVYTLDELLLLKYEHSFKLEEDNINTFVYDNQDYIVIYNTNELIVYRIGDLTNKNAKPYQIIKNDPLDMLTQIQVYNNLIFALIRRDQEDFVGYLDFTAQNTALCPFDLKKLDFIPGQFIVCNERIFIYTDDETNQIFSYKLDEFCDGKTSMGNLKQRTYIGTIQMFINFFKFYDDKVLCLSEDNQIIGLDARKSVRFVNIDLKTNYDITEIVTLVVLDEKKILVETLMKLFLYDMNKRELKLLKEFKPVYEEIVDW